MLLTVVPNGGLRRGGGAERVDRADGRGGAAGLHRGSPSAEHAEGPKRSGNGPGCVPEDWMGGCGCGGVWRCLEGGTSLRSGLLNQLDSNSTRVRRFMSSSLRTTVDLSQDTPVVGPYTEDTGLPEAMSACAKSTAWRKALELFEAMPRHADAKQTTDRVGRVGVVLRWAEEP